MRGTKKIAAVLSLGLGLSVLSGCGLVVKTDEAIAREAAETRGIVLVEGDSGIKVTLGEVLDDYEKMEATWRQQYGEETFEYLAPQLEQEKISIMDTKMRTQLMELKADELNIPKETPAMITEYESIIKGNVEASGGQAKYDQLLKDAGFTEASYKDEVLRGLRLEALLAEVTKDLSVTAEEITKYYEENKATDFTVQPSATIYHIFFGKPDDAAAETKAKEAKAKLDGGAVFADIAKEYGQDDSKNDGGLLGNFPWDTEELGADFMAEAKKLNDGQISDPVKTSFGWHIIKVEDVTREARVQPLTEKVKGDDGVEITLEEQIRSLLLSDKKNARTAELLDEWEAQYNVKRYPERIPMEYEVEEPAVTTPGASTTGTATTGAATTAPATTVPAATTAPATTLPAATTTPAATTAPAAATTPSTTTP